MSTTQSSTIESTLQGCRPAKVEPIVIDAEVLDSTAPEHLRDLKAELSTRGYQPAALSVSARFDDNDTLAIQREADRLRGLVRVATLLGAGRIEVTLNGVADTSVTEPALSAVTERARREGVELVRSDAS